MQAVNLPAAAGWQWIKMGWQLFRLQPAAFFTWTMVISLVLIFSTLAAPIGPLIFIALVPTITYLTLSACRNIHAGRRMLPSHWFLPLKQKKLLGKLLRLGGIYVVICLAAGMIAFLPFSAQLSAAMQAIGDSQNIDLLLDALDTPMMIFAVLYFLLAALFWYAPVLIGWHGTTIAQALFFSAVACWRNKWALVVYAAIWGIIFTGVDILLGLMVTIGIPLSLVAALQVPANILVGSILYCSFYPTYVTVFTQSRMAEEIAQSSPERDSDSDSDSDQDQNRP